MQSKLQFGQAVKACTRRVYRLQQSVHGEQRHGQWARIVLIQYGGAISLHDVQKSVAGLLIHTLHEQ